MRRGLCQIIDGGFDPDYQAVLTNSTLLGRTLPSPSQRIIQNQLMIDIKSVVGSLSAFDWFYVMANDADNGFSWMNWADPTQFNQTPVWTHLSNVGLQASSMPTSNYTPSTDGVAYTLNNASYGFKVGNTPTSWGAGDSLFYVLTALGDISQQNGTALNVTINNDVAVRVDAAGQPQLFDDAYSYTVINRISSTEVKMLHNDVDFGVKTSASTGLPNAPIVFGNRSGDFPINVEFMHIGRALTLAEHTSLRALFNAYMATI